MQTQPSTPAPVAPPAPVLAEPAPATVEPAPAPVEPQADPLAALKAQVEAAKAEQAALLAAKPKGKRSHGPMDTDPRFGAMPAVGATILTVAANPKQAGKAPWTRYNLYQEGMTVEQAIALGVWAADVRWDLAHNYITVGAAS